ncbi:MAG TPA: PEGA domain-containing protein [Luteitalea sp.]|nr:PEGA domain-containing protein [Luteitalea sp.]
MPDEPSGPSRGWLLMMVLLALAAIGQAAYIWLAPSASPGESRLRVDGPDGAAVRVNGQTIGPAPVDHVLAPGDYDIEVGTGPATTRVERLSIGAGRTVVVVPATTVESQTASAAPAAPAATASAPGATVALPTARPESPRPATTSPGPTPNPAATAPAAVSARLGGVLIESTPSGLPVTMEGRARGITPITIGQLKPGRHDVLVGGLPRKVDITAGSVASLRVTRP